MSAPVVIVGSGLAGYNLAREWRKLDSSTPLLLLSADDGRSYSKPMLSTGFGKNKQADELSMAEPGAMAVQLNAEIRTHSRVTAIEPQHNCVWVGAERIVYRDLVLALGAEAVRLHPGGDGTAEIFTVNDLHDYARFRQAAAGKQRVLLLGAGLIGCEFANDLLLGGYQVDVVAPGTQVMPALLPPTAAAAVQAGLESLGARFHLGQLLSSVRQCAVGYVAQLADGREVACDVLLAAAGLNPRTALAQAAGLQVNRGIVVDRLLRSSHPNIYALGDCAEVDGLNLLYVMPLMASARALAHTLAGQPTPVKYGPMPVTVKTPVCPVVVASVPPGMQGDWTVQGSGADIKALCYDAQGALLGYALTGAAVQDRLALNKVLPALLA